MRITGSFEVNAPQAKVWASLWDAETLPVWIPGLVRAEWKDASNAVAEVEQTVALLKARFDFAMTVVERDDPRHVRLRGRGTAPALGIVEMDIAVSLEPNATGNATTVKYDAEVAITGRLATIGHFVITIKSKELQRTVASGVKARLEDGT